MTTYDHALSPAERARRSLRLKVQQRLAGLRWNRDVDAGRCHLYDPNARAYRGQCPRKASKTGKNAGVCRSHQSLLAREGVDILDLRVLPRAPR